MSFYNDAMATWVAAGGDPSYAPVMAAIASAESGSGTQLYGDPSDVTGGYTSFGWWQIHTRSQTDNSPVNTGPGGVPYDESQLANDPLYNATAAIAILRSQGLTAWSTYKNGAYRPFLRGAVPAGAPIAAGATTARTPSHAARSAPAAGTKAGDVWFFGLDLSQIGRNVGVAVIGFTLAIAGLVWLAHATGADTAAVNVARTAAEAA